MPCSELLHSESYSVAASLHETHGPTGAGPKHLPKLPVLALEAMIIGEWKSNGSVGNGRSHGTRLLGPETLLLDRRRRGLCALVLVLFFVFVFVLVPAKLEEPFELRHGTVVMLFAYNRPAITVLSRARAVMVLGAAAKETRSLAVFSIRSASFRLGNRSGRSRWRGLIGSPATLINNKTRINSICILGQRNTL